MICDGVRTWPPKWLQTFGPGRVGVWGEVGVLESVFLSEVFVNKVYLLIHTDEKDTYIGSLMFEKANAARAVFYFLRTCINKPLTSIGSLDLPESFSP